MYTFKNTISLATTASPIDNNLALCSSNDSGVLADALAVIHGNFINIIPIISTLRRSKYVPFNRDDSDGKDVVNQVKWIDIDGVRIFVIASSNGVKFFDEEVNDLLFEHPLREAGDEKNSCKGICGIKSNIVCVGTVLGTIWLFKSDGQAKNFKHLKRVYAHDESVTLLEGMGSFMISSSDMVTFLWNVEDKEVDILRKLEVPGVIASPTVMKFHLGIVVIAYSSGEFCIFDLKDEEFFTRTTAHKLRITGMEFSSNFNIVTVSIDCFIKIWKFHQISNTVELIQSITNDEGPLYAVAFLNFSSTEFCTVTGDDTQVKIYINWEHTLEVNVNDE